MQSTLRNSKQANLTVNTCQENNSSPTIITSGLIENGSHTLTTNSLFFIKRDLYELLTSKLSISIDLKYCKIKLTIR